MEEVKRREMQLYQLKKKIAENDSKLKQQQTLYEAVCSDRNLCSKNLIEARDEITEMKRKLKIMSHQIDQLKEEIASKVITCHGIDGFYLYVHVLLHESTSVCVCVRKPRKLHDYCDYNIYTLKYLGISSCEKQYGSCPRRAREGES